MKQQELYPLKFDPIYQYRIWGGRRLGKLLSKPLPADDPIGEAWILSDRDDHPSKVINGNLEGQTIKDILQHSPEQMLGSLAGKFKRFPLLLKFLDCKKYCRYRFILRMIKKLKSLPAKMAKQKPGW